MNQQPKILIVDDNPNNRLTLRTILKGIDAELQEASNGLDALSMLNEVEYAMVLLDVQMPEMDGYEVCEQLRLAPKAADTPVIFLTAAYKEELNQVRGYVAGATDYLTKPIDDHVLRAKVLVFLKLYTQSQSIKNNELQIRSILDTALDAVIRIDEHGLITYWNHRAGEIFGWSSDEACGQSLDELVVPEEIREGHRHGMADFAGTGKEQMLGRRIEITASRRNGEKFPVELAITQVKAGDTCHFTAFLADITERKLLENQVRQLAFHDPLTKLPNRRLLSDRLNQAMAASKRSGCYGALMFIDLDNFKPLNDTYGHRVGDMLLIEAANRLKSCVRDMDTVSRFGGDEFVVMVSELTTDKLASTDQARLITEKILSKLSDNYLLTINCEGESETVVEHHCTASIGVALFPGYQESDDDPLKQADLAMYQAKAMGRNALIFFDPEMQAVIDTRAALEESLRDAVLNERFVLHFQPQVLENGGLTGAEALLRWNHPVRGMVSPAEFIPLAEETGLIFPLGHWVLQTACRQLAVWAAKPEMAHLTIAVNVSARQIKLPNFVEEVLAIVEHNKTNPLRLKLELTESLLVDNVEDVIGKMMALKKRGVGFSLDDFGTGYSSLSYLKRLPLDQLKIDQSFVRNILTDPNDAAIAKMVIALAETMGLSAIAEGVEIEAQRDFLSHLGCHAYQGYLFSRPLPLEQFENYAKQI